MTGSLNELEFLQRRLRNRFPRASVSLRPPMHERSPWTLDVASETRRCSVQWQPTCGFVLTTADTNTSAGGLPAGFVTQTLILELLERLID